MVAIMYFCIQTCMPGSLLPTGLACVLQRIGGLCAQKFHRRTILLQIPGTLRSKQGLGHFSHISIGIWISLRQKIHKHKYTNKKKRQTIIITICEGFLAFSSWLQSCFHWRFVEYLFESGKVRVRKLFREKPLKISDLHPAKFAELKMAEWQIRVSLRIHVTSRWIYLVPPG